MESDVLVPVAAFLTLIALVRSYADYRVKAKLIQANPAAEMARLVVTPSARRDLFGELKWGIVSVLVGLGIIGGAAIAAGQPAGSQLAEPLRYGIVIISGGVGLLSYFAIASRLARRRDSAASEAEPQR